MPWRSSWPSPKEWREATSPQRHVALSPEILRKVQTLQQLNAVVVQLLDIKGLRPDLTAEIDQCVLRYEKKKKKKKKK